MKSQHPNRYSHCGGVPPSYGSQNSAVQQQCRNSRPQSTDLTDRVPNKHLVDRGVSNLVEGEKPKFTVRKPYIDKDKRDKKSDSWFPSYV